MTDPELLAKRLAVIESCVRELRELARPEAIATDVRAARFVEHTLQLALQATLDAASHIVSDERLGEPSTNRELFDRLEQAGWIEPALAGTLRDMAGFRNILVHGYDTVDLAIVREVVSGGCLLCSEDQPHHCHRRLVAEYLNNHWGGLEVEHLGMAKDARGLDRIRSGRSVTP